MIDILDARQLLIRPTLQYCGLYSRAAENLLIGTGLVESEFKYLIQRQGIALSFFQIEPPTFNWLMTKLSTDKELMLKVLKFLGLGTLPTDSRHLINNLALACICARLKYWYNKEPLPQADDLPSLASYWGRIYNSRNDLKDIKRFIRMYDTYGEHNAD